jgi:hypothetical protein
MKQDVVGNFWIKKNYITFVHIYLQHETIYIYNAVRYCIANNCIHLVNYIILEAVGIGNF